tara:strand:- start:12296 stop:12745 length:450 start_codon:yes stop_codon:yes gene_type:complete
MSKLHFDRKAMPVIPEHRPMYKICQILLILKLSSIGGKSSLIRLHLFNWALKDEKRKHVLMISADKKELSFGVWGIDPSLNMALNYANSEGLIGLNNSGYKLSIKGSEFLLKFKIMELFEDDSKILTTIGKKITEKMVTDVAQRWKNEI